MGNIVLRKNEMDILNISIKKFLKIEGMTNQMKVLIWSIWWFNEHFEGMFHCSKTLEFPQFLRAALKYKNWPYFYLGIFHKISLCSMFQITFYYPLRISIYLILIMNYWCHNINILVIIIHFVILNKQSIFGHPRYTWIY